MRVADYSIFDDFIQAGAEFSTGKRLEDARIGENQLGRIEGADEVLAFRKINSGLSADSAIDLRDQCGGNVNETDSAQIAGGDETRHVANNSTADSHDESAAIGAGFH